MIAFGGADGKSREINAFFEGERETQEFHSRKQLDPEWVLITYVSRRPLL